MTLTPAMLSAVGVFLVFVSTLATAAVTWGVFRAQVERIVEEQRELRAEVRRTLSLVTDISVMTQRLVVIENEVTALRGITASQSHEITRLKTELRRSLAPNGDHS